MELNEVDMENSEVLIKSNTKSLRKWKEIQPSSLSKITKPKNLQSTWRKKMDDRLKHKSMKDLEATIKQGKQAKKEDLAKRQKINREKKMVNERKAEITQKITNPSKIKKTKKKFLRKEVAKKKDA